MWENSRERVAGGWRKRWGVSLGMSVMAQREWRGREGNRERGRKTER